MYQLEDYKRSAVLENYNVLGELLVKMGFYNTWTTVDHYNFKRTIRKKTTRITHELGILFCYHFLIQDIKFFEKEGWKYSKHFICNSKKGLVGFAYFVHNAVVNEDAEKIQNILKIFQNNS